MSKIISAYTVIKHLLDGHHREPYDAGTVEIHEEDVPMDQQPITEKQFFTLKPYAESMNLNLATMTKHEAWKIIGALERSIPMGMEAQHCMTQTLPTVSEETQELVVSPETSLQIPHQENQFAIEAAKQLMDIVNQKGWARKFGGQSEHLQFEAWQTVGRYYNLSVDTDQQPVEYVEYGGVWGFKAHAQVVDSKTGIRVGGASALCMSDEYNWKSKPKFQLMSMAQTRAGSKALRQILAFVVALAGYSPTPYEEMIEVGQDDDKRAIKELKERTRAEREEIEEIREPIIDETASWEGITPDAELAKLGEVHSNVNENGDLVCRSCKKVLTKRELEFSKEYCYIHQRK